MRIRKENTTTKALTPLVWGEAISPKEAAAIARVTPRRITEIVHSHGIGRLVGGRVFVSKPALQMWIDNDAEALHLYCAGDRFDARVAFYFRRNGLDKELLEIRRLINLKREILDDKER